MGDERVCDVENGHDVVFTVCEDSESSDAIGNHPYLCVYLHDSQQRPHPARPRIMRAMQRLRDEFGGTCDFARACVTKSNLGVVVCAGKVLLLDGIKDNCVKGGILMDTVARDDLDTLLDVVRHPLFESLVRVLIEDDVLQPHHQDAYENETLAALYANNLVITMPPPL